MKAIVERVIEGVARARAPKEPPVPAGPIVDGRDNLERPACPLCGNTRAKPLVVARDTWVEGHDTYSVVRCEVCAHRYTTPRFKEACKHLAFEGDYPFYTRAREVRVGRRVDRAEARRPFEGRADRLRATTSQAGRVLDIGCGDGFFLDAMRVRGWSVVGTDVEADVVWHANEVLDIEASVCDLERDPLPEGPFEAVTMWGVLQLLYRPQRALEQVRRLLTDDGILAIGVSNIDSTGARLFGPRWRGLGVPRHLSHFTPNTLERLLAWSGFEVVHVHHETPRWIVAHSADDALVGPASRLAKAALVPALGVAGRTRYGDTMEVYARRISQSGSHAATMNATP